MGNVLKIIAGICVFVLSVYNCARHPQPAPAPPTLGVSLPALPAAPVAAAAPATTASVATAPAMPEPAPAQQLGDLLAQRPIEFTSGTAQFTVAGQAAADEVAGLLAGMPGRSFEVAGHTDSLGDLTANQQLSLARANAVVDYLAGKGLARERFTAKGLGAEQPIADNGTRDGRQKNRRIEITPVGN